MNYNKRRKRKPIYDASLGEPPTPEQEEKMRKQSRNVLDYWLAQSDKSRYELKQKLKNKSITEEIINEILDEYTEKDWINDNRYAQNFVESKQNYERLGRQAIIYKLRTKGIEQHIIEEALSEYDTELAETNCYEIALKKAKQNKHLDKQKRLTQIVGMLSRKGYTENIFQIANSAILEIDAEETDGYNE